MRRRTLIHALLALALFVAAGAASGAAVGASSSSRKSLPGLMTGKGPWGPNDGNLLKARLKAIGLHALKKEGLALHIHEHLDIVINGGVLRNPVPPYVGIHYDQANPSKSFITEIHTHDGSGIIHVESPTVRTFTLGDFFDVWGLRFSSRCLGGYCAAGQKKVWVWVNAKRIRTDPRKIALRSHQEIVVAYGTLASVPKPLPATYPFPQGY